MSQSSDKQTTRLVNMAEQVPEVSEQIFVTAVHPDKKAFFAQFCKYTNQDLVSYNLSINEHCLKVVEKREAGDKTAGAPSKIHRGDILCARFELDNSWYRAIVVANMKSERKCRVMFLDYGNLELVSHDDLILVLPDQVAAIEREPFGVMCLYQGSEEFDADKTDKFLAILYQGYVMIKMLERQSAMQWLVDIPKLAYNKMFWAAFQPESYMVVRQTKAEQAHKLTDAKVGEIDQAIMSSMIEEKSFNPEPSIPPPRTPEPIEADSESSDQPDVLVTIGGSGRAEPCV